MQISIVNYFQNLQVHDEQLHEHNANIADDSTETIENKESDCEFSTDDMYPSSEDEPLEVCT